jgi:hypothetical protein
MNSVAAEVAHDVEDRVDEDAPRPRLDPCDVLQPVELRRRDHLQHRDLEGVLQGVAQGRVPSAAE